CKNCTENEYGHWECLKPLGYLRMACPHCAHTEQCGNQIASQTGHVYTTCSKP
ncbi:hypothetical protein POSPLADRAFT_1097128, partial [Postia placenta MAD-698-R-SB12]